MLTSTSTPVRMSQSNRWRHALAAWRGQLTVTVRRGSDGSPLVIATGENPADFADTSNEVWEVDEDGYWIAARGHLTCAAFAAVVGPVAEANDWCFDPDDVTRDGVQHAYAVRFRSDDKRPGIQDYVYERTGDGTFEAVTIWGAGNLNGAGGPAAPEPIRN